MWLVFGWRFLQVGAALPGVEFETLQNESSGKQMHLLVVGWRMQDEAPPWSSRQLYASRARESTQLPRPRGCVAEDFQRHPEKTLKAAALRYSR